MKLPATLLPLCLAAACELAAWPLPAVAKDLPDAPTWTLKDMEGNTVRLADFRGRVVVLDFWAAWCPPCLKEVPGLIELQKKYAGRGLMVIGVSLDDDLLLLKAALRKLDVNYPVVLGTPAVAATYGLVTVLPSTFVVDREGKITALHEGFCKEAVLEADLKPLL